MSLGTANPHSGGVLTGAGATRALLLPRLLTTTADRRLVLGLGSALTVVVQDSLNMQIHADLVDFFVKQSRELNIVFEIASCGEELCSCH